MKNEKIQKSFKIAPTEHPVDSSRNETTKKMQSIPRSQYIDVSCFLVQNLFKIAVKKEGIDAALI